MTKKNIVFELVNFSDQCTLVGNNPEAACLIIAIAGQGAFGLKWKEEGEEKSMPPLRFGGFEEFFKENFNLDPNKDDRLENDLNFCGDCAEFLESAAYVSVEDRASYDEKLNRYRVVENWEKFRSEHENKNRSSMNKIVQNFWKVAKNLRKRQQEIDKHGSVNRIKK